MTVLGALAGAFVGTLVLTSALRLASALRWTRIDIPFLLGTMFTANRTRAKWLGYVLHALAGLVFGLMYAGIFVTLGRSGWLLGALLGVLHGLIAGTAIVGILFPLAHTRVGSTSSAADGPALLEPPGFLMLNYGRMTPAVTVPAHVLYGTLVGGFASLL